MTGATDPVGLLGCVPREGVVVASTHVTRHSTTVATVILGRGGGEGRVFLQHSIIYTCQKTERQGQDD